MKKIIPLLLFFILNSKAQVNENTTFSVLTIGAGSELYSTFGHTAIRIRDESIGLDDVYNYGGFDFNTPGFYNKFLKGQLPYMMDKRRYEQEFMYWQFEGRMVIEQTLNLNTQQKNRIYQALATNYLPENRFYKYKFFYDNCSTRVKDIFLNSFGDSVKVSETLNANLSYRQWIDSCARERKQWANFGMQLAIGSPSDEFTGAKGATFLPMNLMLYLDSTKIFRNGKLIKLVQSKQPIIFVQDDAVKPSFLSPMLVSIFILVLVAGFTFYQFYTQKHTFGLDKMLFSFVGLCGWFLSFLWFGTDHGVTVNNLNVVWAFPILFPLAFYLKKTGTRQWLSVPFLAFALINFCVVVCWKFLPQALPNALIPFNLALIIRATWVWWRLRRVL